jgi:hypothetical protein
MPGEPAAGPGILALQAAFGVIARQPAAGDRDLDIAAGGRIVQLPQRAAPGRGTADGKLVRGNGFQRDQPAARASSNASISTSKKPSSGETAVTWTGVRRGSSSLPPFPATRWRGSPGRSSESGAASGSDW